MKPSTKKTGLIDRICALLEKHGPMTTNEIANAVGLKTRHVSSAMLQARKYGKTHFYRRSVRHKYRGGEVLQYALKPFEEDARAVTAQAYRLSVFTPSQSPTLLPAMERRDLAMAGPR